MSAAMKSTIGLGRARLAAGVANKQVDMPAGVSHGKAVIVLVVNTHVVDLHNDIPRLQADAPGFTAADNLGDSQALAGDPAVETELGNSAGVGMTAASTSGSMGEAVQVGMACV